MTSPTLRAVVVGESLKAGSLPTASAGMEDRRYRSRLGDQTEIEIIELTVPVEQAAALALELSAVLKPRFFYAHLCVRVWDRDVRESGYPPMTVYPAATPDDQLPPGDVLDKPSARLVLQWPERTPAGALSLSTAGGQRA
ncbi:hypothetical protein [Streptomyces alanosinicus]|uniref:Uncharacterized protein n=1 Tax=Streptomyces alanosinicus TaxID=68171 RepID=A0A918YR66_9ACTN|nr:hypothetical protein [Streptomyces alanosinicus]GHE12027.1 hypothetical protein GCM10010339_73890 [Streptomyces alanosinicus]